MVDTYSCPQSAESADNQPGVCPLRFALSALAATVGAGVIEASERALSFPLGDHDACLYIGGLGDALSVPALLHGLRWVGDLEEVNECTVHHCYDALRRVTGHDAGRTRGAWVDWRQTTGSKLPPSAFPPARPHPRPPRPPSSTSEGPRAAPPLSQ